MAAIEQKITMAVALLEIQDMKINMMQNTWRKLYRKDMFGCSTAAIIALFTGAYYC